MNDLMSYYSEIQAQVESLLPEAYTDISDTHSADLIGKTTVARHYAKFLTSLEVLPGNAFIETTGSRLANDGVAGIKKHIEEVVNAGGGTIFVDEAYQLADEHNFQGSQVHDFLLAEMENK